MSCLSNNMENLMDSIYCYDVLWGSAYHQRGCDLVWPLFSDLTDQGGPTSIAPRLTEALNPFHQNKVHMRGHNLLEGREKTIMF